MGVDFHWIGTTISSGSSHNGFGKIVSSSSVSGIPPEGFAYIAYNVVYPAVQGGEQVVVPELYPYEFENQICDVEVWHDGVGGFYNNWSTVSNIEYSTAVIGTVTETQTPVELPSPNQGNYVDSEVRTTVYTHDGSANYSVAVGNWGYYANGTSVNDAYNFSQQQEVPTGSGNYYDTGKINTNIWDGNGGITIELIGSFYPNNTYIVSVSIQSEVPAYSGSYYDNGKYVVYRWNGSGGITSSVEGSFYTNGTYIMVYTITEQVPEASGNYYATGQITTYYWNGAGGIYGVGGGAYYPYGTYITDDGVNYVYYWNGAGGYYTENYV